MIEITMRSGKERGGMMPYKLIALDMDGTLLNRNKEISRENLKWIRAASEAGIKVTLATGRPIRDILRYAEQLAIDCPVVTTNGSEVWRTPHQLHSRKVIEPNLIERLLETDRNYGGELDFWAHTVSGRVDRSCVPDDLAGVQWLQFSFRSKNLQLLEQIRDEIAGWQMLEISNSHITNIEFNPLGVSKASGLQEVCSLLGIEMREVIAIGDSLNDISMIRAAGLGIAMGNAQEAVKQAADAVSLSNEEDGVAKAIERYAFGR